MNWDNYQRFLPFESWIQYCSEKYALLTSKPLNGIQLTRHGSLPPAPGYNSHKTLRDPFYSMPCFSTSIKRDYTTVNEVPFTSPKCSHTALSEDTKTRVQLRQHTLSLTWRILHHTDLKKIHLTLKIKNKPKKQKPKNKLGEKKLC